MIVSREEGERRLRPYLDRLAQAIRGGEHVLNGVFGDQKHRFKPRSLSSSRNDLVIAEARRVFEGDQTVRFETRYGRDIMYVGDDAIIVFKKLDRSRRTQNIPTQLALKLFGQQPLDGMPGETPRFVAGWQMDTLGLAIQVMMITHPSPLGVEWVIPLDDSAAGGAGTVPITPPSPPSPPADTARVRRKADERREDERSTSSSG